MNVESARFRLTSKRETDEFHRLVFLQRSDSPRYRPVVIQDDRLVRGHCREVKVNVNFRLRCGGEIV